MCIRTRDYKLYCTYCTYCTYFSLFFISMQLKTILLISVEQIIKISFLNPNFNDQEDAEIRTIVSFWSVLWSGPWLFWTSFYAKLILAAWILDNEFTPFKLLFVFSKVISLSLLRQIWGWVTKRDFFEN